MGCQCFNYLSVSLKCFKCEFPLCIEFVIFAHLLFMLVLNAFYDFKYDTDKTCMSYLLYSPVRPMCLILFYLVSDVGPADIEAECAVGAVEPPVDHEWQPNNVM